MRFAAVLLLGFLFLPNAAFSADTTSEPLKIEILKAAAEMGNVDAQLLLGERYSVVSIGWAPGVKRDAVKQDYVEAMKWYRMAADQGNSEAQSTLGVFYKNGLGTKQDNAEAFKWYRKAADQGDALAQWSIGQMFKNGEGVKQDSEQAYFWELVAEKSQPDDPYSPHHEYYAKQLTPESIAAIKKRAQEWKPIPAPAEATGKPETK
jgi:TPR repeat protein